MEIKKGAHRVGCEFDHATGKEGCEVIAF